MKRSLLFLMLVFMVPPAQAFDLGGVLNAIGGVNGGSSNDAAENFRRIQQGLKLVQALIPISDEEEKILGRSVAARVIERFQIADAPEQTYYLNLIGTAIAQRSDRPEIDYHFAVLATDDVNAYACPGGFIFVTRGVLGMVKDEAELAAVLAHEIAHVTERHIVKALQQSKIMKVGTEVAAAEFNAPGPLFDAMTQFATDALFKGLKKDDEYASDMKSVEYLDRLGYDYPAMFDVLKHLDMRRRMGMTKVLSKTHPNPKYRLKKIEAASRKMDLDEPTHIRLPERFARHI
ncbi:MAG: M48 family metalloprotease [Mariprofundaceae bacterium]